MSDVAGKTVVITGASRGIGEASARLFANQGANVVLLARSESAINAISAEIGDAALAIACDVSSYADMEKAVQAACESYGKVDVLINNAGVIEPISHLATADPAEWAKAIDINLTGVFNGMRAVLPAMIKAKSGTILTISSGAAHNAIEAWSHYCSSKAGAAMLTRMAHLENAAYGLRCMGLSPGTVATQMQKEIKTSGINAVSQLDWDIHIPAEWPAQTLLWMCGTDADAWLGEEISLRDESIRARVGLS
ncbi:SDR family oxidoreductase [Planktotalea frisia]|jgi:NADP-dependent 3-hydroxy acid dehydrogenase YdfG|uniref:SDR family oxidoreductase n=1 Tax=Planktotalea frisia TaxID=696762 RepID=UPI0023576F07|nr:SDR family oxidoreductase [Planktotalea frisia]